MASCAGTRLRHLGANPSLLHAASHVIGRRWSFGDGQAFASHLTLPGVLDSDALDNRPG
jgi:hypothetical protein